MESSAPNPYCCICGKTFLDFERVEFIGTGLSCAHIACAITQGPTLEERVAALEKRLKDLEDNHSLGQRQPYFGDQPPYFGD